MCIFSEKQAKVFKKVAFFGALCYNGERKTQGRREKMDRYFVLLGGGELKTKQTLALDRVIGELAKQRAGDRRANALFVGTASHDLMPYYNTFHKTYTGELDIKTDVALTVFTEMNAEKLDAKFAKADLIYVGGGDTVFMLDAWRKSGLGERILDAYRRGVIVAGLSAGAICWFEKMYTDSAPGADGKAPYAVFPALGILKGGACPHYDDRRADFAENVPEGGKWLCIENVAAAVYRNETLVGVLENGKNAYTVCKNGGKVTETPIPVWEE